MEYANDCLYLAERARKLASGINIRDVQDAEALQGRFMDVAEKLEVIGESWVQGVIVSRSENATMENGTDAVH